MERRLQKQADSEISKTKEVKQVQNKSCVRGEGIF